MSDRAALIEKMKARFDERSADLAKLQAQARSAEAEARIEFDRRIEEATHQRDEAGRELAEAKSAAGGAWQDLKNGFRVAWTSIAVAFQSARSRFG
jgi:hypothetical protein